MEIVSDASCLKCIITQVYIQIQVAYADSGASRTCIHSFVISCQLSICGSRDISVECGPTQRLWAYPQQSLPPPPSLTPHFLGKCSIQNFYCLHISINPLPPLTRSCPKGAGTAHPMRTCSCSSWSGLGVSPLGKGSASPWEEARV